MPRGVSFDGSLAVDFLTRPRNLWVFFVFCETESQNLVPAGGTCSVRLPPRHPCRSPVKQGGSALSRLCA
jgi:hypothetical protein